MSVLTIDLLGDARDNVARQDLLAVRHRQHRIDREVEDRVGLAGVGRRALLDDGEARSQAGAANLLAPIDHHLLGDAAGLVHGLAQRKALDQVVIDGAARLVGDHRQVERVPAGKGLAHADALAVLHQQARAARHAVMGAPAAFVLIDDLDLAAVRHHDGAAVAVDHHLGAGQPDHALHLAVDGRGDIPAALGGSADVEGAPW